MSRRPPSLRNAEYGLQHLARQTKSMIPGTAGGRLASSSPVRPGGSTGSLSDASTVTDSQMGTAFATDEFNLAGPVTTLTLTYLPVVESCSVYLNGLEAREGTDYTISDQVITILSPLNVGSGDVINARYTYVAGVESAPGDVSTSLATYVASTQTTTASGQTSITATVPTARASGDLLLAAVTRKGPFSAPSGWDLVAQLVAGTDTLAVFSRISDGTEGAVTFTSTNPEFMSLALLVYRGVVDTGLLDVQTATATGQPWTYVFTAPAVTTNLLATVVYVVAQDSFSSSSDTIATPSGVTVREAVNLAAGLAYLVVGDEDDTDGGTSTTRSFTDPSSDAFTDHNWLGITLALKGA